MNIKDKIVEKIKKLLELTTSPNEAEAKAAMEHAQRLMIKHSIDQSSLENDEPAKQEILRSEYWNDAFGRPGLMKQVPKMIGIIGPIFGVYSLTTIKGSSIMRIDMIGFETNIDITRFAMDSIITQGIIEAKIAYKQYRTTTFGDSFWEGFVLGLNKKFGNLKNDSEGIVVYNKVKQYVESISSASYKTSQSDGLAHRAGFEAGQKVELRKGLTHSNTGKLLN